MILNDFGEIAFEEWVNLPKRYPNMVLDAFQVMPNHIHGIIVLVDNIRNETAYNRIANYIINNPVKWKDDGFYSKS